MHAAPAAAAVLVQALYELGRRDELRSTLVSACGSVHAVPLDAVMLAARLSLLEKRASEARSFLSDALELPSGQASTQPLAAIEAAVRLLVLEVMTRECGDAVGAVSWLVRCPPRAMGLGAPTCSHLSETRVSCHCRRHMGRCCQRQSWLSF